MSDHREWLHRIDHILEAAEQIIEFTKDTNYEDFIDNKILYKAVERNFEIIGEAARLVPQDKKDIYKDVHWFELIGVRNRLAHDYLGIRDNILWETIQNDLPILTQQMINILQKEESGDNNDN